MRINEVSPSVHGSNAICITIGYQSQVTHAHAYSAGKCSQIAADRLRVHSTEAGVKLSPDLLYLTPRPLQDAFDHPSTGAIHRINHQTLGELCDEIKVDQCT